MYFDSRKYNYNVDLNSANVSLHSGVPNQYYDIKDKNFGDWEIPPWELFIFKDRLIGEGAFSKVYLAKWRETFVVAKVINSDLTELKKYLIEREIDIMTKLHHPNIVQFLGYIESPFIIVMEYIPNGNLEKRIPFLKKSQKIKIMINILQGLAYLHNRLPYSLIHRDIKPNNIVLTASNFAKITDFGLSKFHCFENGLTNLEFNTIEFKKESGKYLELTDCVGTERYMAPEMKEYINDYTNKVDIYSTGILLYELFENKKHIPGENFYWSKCPKKIRKVIIEHMLQRDPNLRWSAQYLIKLLNDVI